MTDQELTITEDHDGQRPRLQDRLLDLEELLTMPDEPVPWRCDRLAADGHVTLITGVGGEGKSLLTLALAKAVADGASVAGIECAAGNVVVFDAENGERLISQRAKAADLSPGSIHFYESDGFDLQHDVQQFEEAIRRHEAKLAILDSLRILAPTARESEADHMAPLMSKIRRLARRTNAAIIVIHHRGKGENASDFRGSSTIRDQTDMMFVLGRDQNDPDGATRRYLRTSKLRIDAEPEPRWFSLVFDEDGRFTLEEADAFGDEGSGQTGVQILASQIEEHLSEEPQTRASLARAVGREAGDGQAHRALRLLATRGIAEQVGTSWKLVIQPAEPQETEWMDGAPGALATVGAA